MNTTMGTDTTGVAEEDRLPWLESADDDFKDGPSGFRVIALVVIALALIGAAIWAFTHFSARTGTEGSGEMIEAADGDYKVKPDQPGGMKVEGEGDTVFRTSEGAGQAGSIDTRAVPEAPVAGKAAKPAAKSAPGTAQVVTRVPESSGRLTAQPPSVDLPKAVAGGGGGSVVQLGSFPSEGAANSAWSMLSKRFAYVGALGKSVEKAEVAGNTVYRLRVNAGSAGNANSICGRLKVAGEACFVPN
jgi:hypothetical protein